MANVAVFDNPAFVDTGDTTSSESDTVQAWFRAEGHAVSTFSGTEAADFTAATSGTDILVFPEFENGYLLANGPAKAAITSFVNAGGSIFIYGYGGDQAVFLNALFGFSLREFTFSDTTARTAAAAGTPWATGAAQLPWNNGTEGLELSSLPAGSIPVYANSIAAALAAMPYGQGQIIFIGWDWFDGAPMGTQNSGWLAAATAAVEFVSNQTPIEGTSGNDPALTGTSASERVDMLAGDDIYTMNLTGNGYDRIDGGEGGEVLGDLLVINDSGATGRTVSIAMAGLLADVKHGNTGTASTTNVERIELNLAAGNDVVSLTGNFAASGLEKVRIMLGSGNDQFSATASALPREIFGGSGSDIIAGAAGADIADGGADFDLFSMTAATRGAFINLADQSQNAWAAGGDRYTGFESFFLTNFGDQFSGDASSMILFGFDGNDILQGSSQADIFVGGAGADYLGGRGGLDSAYYHTSTQGIIIDQLAPSRNTGDAAGDYFDSIEGFVLTDFGDSFQGSNPVNFVYAGNGNDQMFGSVYSNDWFFGGDGDDFLAGGTGNDRLEGGAGNDVFAFANLQTGAIDIIADFNPGNDRIQLTGPNFGGLSAGHAFTAGSDFIIGTGASLISSQARPTMLYDYVSGMLSFDADGSGASAPLQFAILSSAPGLSPSDLTVVGIA